jgi:hypothetical protein
VTRLQRLDICSFRGIRELSLAFDGGSIVLGGGNGTGKSACVDAIELLYAGSVSSLSGTQGLSLKQHGAHIHARFDDAKVSAAFTDPDETVTRHLSGRLDVPAEIRGHIEEGSRLAFILRRAQVQQFIHAKPADRYRSMADLIGAEALDRTELGLKRARDVLERQLGELQARLAQVETQVAALPAETPSDDALLAAANGELEHLGATAYHLDDLIDVASVREAVLRQVSAGKPDPRMQARAQLREELRRGIGQTHLRQSADVYLELGGSTPGGASARSVELLQLLRRGRDYLHVAHAGQCPLCERAVDERRLLERLIERVAELEEVSLHDQRMRQAQEELGRAAQDTASRVRALTQLQTDAGMRGPGRPVVDATSMLTESMRAGAPVEIRDMTKRVLHAVGQWDAWAEEIVEAIEAELTLDDEGTPEHRQAYDVLGILEQLMARRAAAERGRQELDRLTVEQDRLNAEIFRQDRILRIADTTYQTFNRVKNAEIQRVYDGLRTDLARMYDFLHPGEGHGAVAIAMDPRKRGSSELKMDFYDRDDEDPRAFASEGHLDSLGLCIFLAFARRFNGDWPLLVLDDVVASVDAGHKRRIAQLLFQEFGERQLFITTQDSRWFLDLQRAQEETGRGDARSLIIESWSVEGGPKLRAGVS